MNRRSFMKALAAIGAAGSVVGRVATIVVMTPIAAVMVGCGFSVSGVLTIIVGAVQGLLSIAGNAAWATDLSAALVTLQQNIATWKTGGAIADVIDALNTIEAITAVIPFTAVYSPLVDLLVSGIESVITYFANNNASVRSTKFTRQRGTLNNAHVGRVLCKMPDKLHPTYEGALKAQWNALADSLQLQKAEIK